MQPHAAEFHPSEPTPESALVRFSGQLVDMSKKPSQCKEVQTLFEVTTISEKEAMFDELFPAIDELIYHIHGNYVMQKLV
jgi:hypothetical protein